MHSVYQVLIRPDHKHNIFLVEKKGQTGPKKHIYYVEVALCIYRQRVILGIKVRVCGLGRTCGIVSQHA